MAAGLLAMVWRTQGIRYIRSGYSIPEVYRSRDVKGFGEIDKKILEHGRQAMQHRRRRGVMHR